MPNCTSEPASVPSDAGVAGLGVLLSFMITAAIAIVISTSLVIQEQFTDSKKQSLVRRRLLNAFSDQQILTGICIQSVGLIKMDTMIPYHFFIIWMLSLLSMAVHNTTLLALVHDFRRDWVLRWLRQFLMFVNLVLSCVYGGFMLMAVQKNMTDTMIPISCVWDNDDDVVKGPPTNYAEAFAGTIAVIAGNVIVFLLATWYLHSRTQKFYKIIQLVGIVLMIASAIGATVRVIVLSQAFGNPPINLSDTGEKSWTFGTTVTLGMLLLPVVSVIEILRGEVRCAPPVIDSDDKTGLLHTSSNELHEFQPSPFWGRRNG
ncbi:hypothetical protein BJ170DRAFT_603771 [Xylariales sp. AK1849]|nr:hypothetical protein BJ170DRAFT_603771 [Xylariales sp. AK1849]